MSYDTSTVPPVLSSAQTVLGDGFARLNRGAAKIASVVTGVNAAGPDITEGLVGGVLDTLQARSEVRAGVALMDTYQRMSDEVVQMAEPTGEERREGRGGALDVYG